MSNNVMPFPVSKVKVEAQKLGFEITPEEFAARTDYERSKNEPTQNIYGVRVGDLFVASFGYDMTIVEFYQVIELRGKLSAVVQRIASRDRDGDGFSGHVSPCRNEFMGEPELRRTSWSWKGQDEPCIFSPHASRKLSKTTDDERHYYNTMD